MTLVFNAGSLNAFDSSEVIRSSAWAAVIGSKLTAAVTQRIEEAVISMNLIMGVGES